MSDFRAGESRWRSSATRDKYIRDKRSRERSSSSSHSGSRSRSRSGSRSSHSHRWKDRRRGRRRPESHERYRCSDVEYGEQRDRLDSGEPVISHIWNRPFVGLRREEAATFRRADSLFRKLLEATGASSTSTPLQTPGPTRQTARDYTGDTLHKGGDAEAARALFTGLERHGLQNDSITQEPLIRVHNQIDPIENRSPYSNHETQYSSYNYKKTKRSDCHDRHDMRKSGDSSASDMDNEFLDSSFRERESKSRDRHSRSSSAECDKIATGKKQGLHRDNSREKSPGMTENEYNNKMFRLLHVEMRISRNPKEREKHIGKLIREMAELSPDLFRKFMVRNAESLSTVLMAPLKGQKKQKEQPEQRLLGTPPQSFSILEREGHSQLPSALKSPQWDLSLAKQNEWEVGQLRVFKSSFDQDHGKETIKGQLALLPLSKRITSKQTNVSDLHSSKQILGTGTPAHQPSTSVLPTQLPQSHATALTGEEKIAEESSNAKLTQFSFHDPGDLCCIKCGVVCNKLPDFLAHLSTNQHQQMQTSGSKQEGSLVNPKPAANTQPFKGEEFLQCTPTFYCTLCKEACADASIAEAHLKSMEHNKYYLKHLSQNAAYANYMRQCSALLLKKKATGSHKKAGNSNGNKPVSGCTTTQESSGWDKKYDEQRKEQDLQDQEDSRDGSGTQGSSTMGKKDDSQMKRQDSRDRRNANNRTRSESSRRNSARDGHRSSSRDQSCDRCGHSSQGRSEQRRVQSRDRSRDRSLIYEEDVRSK